MKCRLTLVIILLVSVPLVSCNRESPSTEDTIAPPSQETEALEETEEPSPEITPDEPDETQIIIDGDPSDWANYDVLLTDPEGDHQGGGFDIANVSAFTNDQCLYMLIETHGPREDYVQLDLEIRSGNRMFVLASDPEAGTRINMGEIVGGEWVDIGEINGSDSIGDQAIEIKVPLSAFDGATNLTLNVRPMAGECCDADWNPVDQIDPVRIVPISEVEGSL